MLFGGLAKKKPLLKYLLQAAYDGLSDEGWLKLSRNWAFFFAFMALLNEARSEEHTSELQSLMRISYAVFCLKKKKHNKYDDVTNRIHSTHKTTYRSGTIMKHTL